MIEIVGTALNEIPADGNLRVIINNENVPPEVHVTEIRLRELPASETSLMAEIPQNLQFYQTVRGGSPSNTYVTFLWVEYPDGTLPLIQQALDRIIADTITKRCKVRKLAYRTALERYIAQKAFNGNDSIKVAIDPSAWRENTRARWIAEIEDGVARLVTS